MVMPMVDMPGRSNGALGFEVQALLNGKWHTEAAFDDPSLAQDEAIRLFQSKRQPEAVRVVRNVIDPGTNLISGNTVFRRSRAEDGKLERQRDMKVKEATARRKKIREQNALKEKNKNHGLLLPLIIGVGLIVLILGSAWYYYMAQG